MIRNVLGDPLLQAMVLVPHWRPGNDNVYPPCTRCGGDGEALVRKVDETGQPWVAPVDCPQCGGTGRRHLNLVVP